MRTIAEQMEAVFIRIHEESVSLVDREEFEKLMLPRKPFGKSPCELIVRSAAKVEQCFGGITTRLWDDPFEWTLPECMKGSKAVLEYLSEAESVRKRGFLLIESDADLTKKIAAPESLSTLFAVILNASIEADRFLAFAKATIALPVSGSRKSGYRPGFS